jgi:hypothetical protein
MLGVKGQSTSTPIAWVSGKKSPPTGGTVILRLADGQRSSAASHASLAQAFVLTQLATRRTNRFLLDRAADRPLLDQLCMHGIANFDRLILQCIQPADASAFIHFAQFFAQLSREGCNPFSNPVRSSCHP